MNGINYSSLLNNTGIFSNQTNKDEATFTGTVTGANRKVSTKKTDVDNKQSNVDRDTYEYSGQTREVKAGASGDNDRHPEHLTEQPPEQALAQRYSPAPDNPAGTRLFGIADLQAVFHLLFTSF